MESGARRMRRGLESNASPVPSPADQCAGNPAAKPRRSGWRQRSGADLFDMGPQRHHRGSGEVLLRLVTQSSRRCSVYASLIEQACEATERLPENTMDDLAA